MSNFFEKKYHDFWNVDFLVLSRGKKAVVNYCLYECKQIIIKKWKN